MRERKFEVIVKQGRFMTSVTINAERTTIKIPEHIPESDREKVYARVASIEDKVREQSEGTMRGFFTVDLMELEVKNVSRTKSLKFSFWGR